MLEGGRPLSLQTGFEAKNGMILSLILSLFAISSLSVFIAILHNGCIVHAGTSDNYFWLDITCLMLCKPSKVKMKLKILAIFPLSSTG